MKNNKHSLKKRMDRQIVGLKISWCDDIPETGCTKIFRSSVTHSNSALRLIADQIYAQNKDYIINQQSYLWKANMGVVFIDEKSGGFVTDTREMTAYTKLTDLENISLELFEDVKRENKELKYSHVEWLIECIGTSPATQLNDDAKEYKINASA